LRNLNLFQNLFRYLWRGKIPVKSRHLPAHYQDTGLHARYHERERIREHWPVQLNLQVRCPSIPDKHQTCFLESWQLSDIILELVRLQIYGPRHDKDRPCRPKYLVRVGGDYPVWPCQADSLPAWRRGQRGCSVPQNSLVWNVGA